MARTSVIIHAVGDLPDWSGTVDVSTTTVPAQSSVGLPGVVTATVPTPSSVLGRLVVPSPVITTIPSGGGSTTGIFTSPNELATQPISGSAWNRVLSAANSFSSSMTEYDNQNSTDATYAYSSALVYARTGTNSYRSKVRDAINTLSNASYDKGNGTALGYARKLAAWVFAADLIDLKNYAPSVHADFVNFLDGAMTTSYSGDGGSSLLNLAERRPNNIGVFARMSCTAIAVYIEDTNLQQLMYDLMYSWVVNQSAYPSGDTRTGENGWNWGSDQSWQYTTSSSNWLGINPAGSTKSGHNIDGIYPDDYRRNGSFSSTNFPGPAGTDYPWDVQGGVAITAEVLYRAGFTQAKALANDWVHRGLARLHHLSTISGSWDYAPSGGDGGDDQYIPALVNYMYRSKTQFPEPSSQNHGRPIAWTDWTHSGRTAP